MKKAIMILGLAVCVTSLAALGMVENNNEALVVDGAAKTSDVPVFVKEPVEAIRMDDFALDIAPRFLATVSKEKLDKAISISDIIPEDAGWENKFFSQAHVRIVNSDLEVVGEEFGFNLNLTEAQIKLLKTAKYSDDLQFGTKNGLNYMVTVVPEKQTVYNGGPLEPLASLRSEVSNLLALQNVKRWDAGKIKFTVDASGEISNAFLISSCGNETVDQHMLRAIKELPESWKPAENAEGVKVDQTLTLSFGNMGC